MMTALQPTLRNLQLVFENSSAAIYDCSEHRLVYVRWKQATDMEAWLSAANFIADFLSDCEYDAYIADGKESVPMPHDAIFSVMQVVVPLFKEAGLKYLAIVIPEDLSVEMTMQALINEFPMGFEAMHSSNVEESLQWILEKRA